MNKKPVGMVVGSAVRVGSRGTGTVRLECCTPMESDEFRFSGTNARRVGGVSVGGERNDAVTARVLPWRL